MTLEFIANKKQQIKLEFDRLTKQRDETLNTLYKLQGAFSVLSELEEEFNKKEEPDGTDTSIIAS